MSPETRLKEIAKTLAALSAEVQVLSATIPRPPDAVLRLDAAAQELGCSKSWLERKANWQRVGGYLDTDRRVKFSASKLEAYKSARDIRPLEAIKS